MSFDDKPTSSRGGQPDAQSTLQSALEIISLSLRVRSMVSEKEAAPAAEAGTAVQPPVETLDERGRRHDRSFRPATLFRRGRAPSRTVSAGTSCGPNKVIRRRRSVTPLSLPSTIKSDLSPPEQV